MKPSIVKRSVATVVASVMLTTSILPMAASAEEATAQEIPQQDTMQQIIQAIDKLPAPSAVNVINEQAINEAQQQVAMLTEEQRLALPNYAKLQALITTLATVKVIDSIAKLPAVSLTNATEILQVEAAYNALADKQAVKNAAKLQEALTQLTTMQKPITAFEQSLAKFTDATITKEVLFKLEESYNALNETQRQYVDYNQLKHWAELLEQNHKALITAIAALPKPEQITVAHRAQIEQLLTSFHALSLEQQQAIPNAFTLLEADAALEVVEKSLNTTAKQVQMKIAVLPTTLDSKDRELIIQVRALYEQLTTRQKHAVSNYQRLVEAERALLIQGDAVMTLIAEIAKLPALTKLSIKEQALVEQLKNNYNALSAAQKVEVTNAAILLAAEQKMQALMDADKKDKIKPINDAIDKIIQKSQLTLADESKIADIRTALSGLTNEQLSQVKNLDKFKKLEEQMVSTKTKIRKIIADIAALPAVEKITVKDDATVQAIRKSLGGLSTVQREDIWNYTKLVAIEDAIHMLKMTPQAQYVFQAIEKLPVVGQIRLVDESQVLAVQSEYEQLALGERIMITNYQKLLEAGKQIITLKQQQAPKGFEHAFTTSKGISSLKEIAETHTLYLTTSALKTIDIALAPEFIAAVKAHNYEQVSITTATGVVIDVPLAVFRSQLRKTSTLLITKKETVVANRPAVMIELSERTQSGKVEPLNLANKAIKIRVPLAVFQTFNQNGALLMVKEDGFVPVMHRVVNDVVEIQLQANGHYIYSTEWVSFRDVAQHPDALAVEKLATRHIIKGVTPATFAPNKKITRAQFGAMIARALHLTAHEQTVYEDVKGQWYERDIQALYEAGITKSTGDYQPNALLTRQHAAVFMARVLAYTGQQIEAKQSSSYIDQQAIGKDYVAAVALLKELNIMGGRPDNTFGPQENLTRIQMAKILYRTMLEAKLL